MENILYIVDERDIQLKKSKNDILLLYDLSNQKLDEKVGLKEAIRLDYNLNYTCVQLTNILDYYEINSRKLKKMEKINEIINFEMDESNNEKVTKRKLLWDYYKELSNDRFFNKYIIGKL